MRRRQKVDRMKKMEIQMISLLRMNMPTEHSISEMKLVPSAYYCEIRRVGSYSRMLEALFLLIINNIYPTTHALSHLRFLLAKLTSILCWRIGPVVFTLFLLF